MSPESKPPSLPRLALGAMRLSDPGVADPVAVLRAAIAAGLKIIDTADVYGPDAKSLHHNESLVAEALRGLSPSERAGITVATKVGLARKATRWMPEGDPKALTKAAEKSLKALGGDALDLLQLHVRDGRWPLEESLGALGRLYEKGKVKALGLCNTTLGNVATALTVLPRGSLVSVQNALSPVGPGVPADAADAALLLPLVQQLGWTFLAHSPFGGREKSASVATHKALRPIHAALVADMGDRAPDAWGLVLAWLRTLSPAIVPLFGATRVETVGANVAAASEPLPASAIAAMDKAFPALAALRTASLRAAVRDEDDARRLGLERVAALPVAGDGVTLTVGIQGAGKSSAIQPFLDAGQLRLNRDTLGGKLDDMIPLLKQHLATAAAGQRAAILDNTYPTARSRAPVIAAARAAGVPVRAIWLDTPVEEARINVIGRMIELTGGLQGPDELKQLQKQYANLIPPIAHAQFVGVFEPPTLLEGFDAVERRPFVRRKAAGTTKGLLLDVDGTLRVTRSGEKYPMSADDFEILPGRRDVLDRWVAAGWSLFFVSNQSGIASGKVAREVVAEAFANTIKALGVPIADVAFCPHPAFPVGCFCRKPMPGLGVWLQQRHALNPDHLVMVGDLGSDAGFAAAIGARFFSAETFFGPDSPAPDAC